MLLLLLMSACIVTDSILASTASRRELVSLTQVSSSASASETDEPWLTDNPVGHEYGDGLG
jgi:hypothetical protein